MGKRLLLIDDDIGAKPKESVPGTMNYMWYYADALRNVGHHDVTEVNGVDLAVSELAAKTFDLIVLDLMMPPGKTLADAETARGMRTGVVFADWLLQSYAQTPVVILTMVTDPHAAKALLRKPNVKKILQKTEYEPDEVVEELREVLGA
jgi:CheY-like chemotaxis protein